MGVKVMIPGYLQDLTGKKEIIELEANSVIDSFNKLVDLYPEMKILLFNDNDPTNSNLLKRITVFVNGTVITPGEIEKPLHDGDELGFIFTLTGG